MLKDFNYGSCLSFLTIFCFWSLADGASDPVTCPSIYIDFLCIPFRFDGKSWPRAMRTCIDYAVQEFSGANMAAIPSASRQKGIEKFLDRIIMSPLWIGGVENRVVWRWRKDNLDLLSQGCYHNLSSNFFQVFSSDNIMTVGKCLDICMKASNGYAAINKMNLCFCGDVINRADKSDSSNCNFTCSSTNQFSWWCGGYNESYFTIFRIGGVGAKWGWGQPDNQSGREFCAAIDLNLNGGLADEDCNQTYLFACSFGASKQGCQATGQRLISQVCYYLSNRSLMMTWQEAGQSCQDMGAELVTLNSDLQQMALRNWIAQTYGQPDMKVWVGAYIGGWRWLAANTFTYTNWAPDEPQTSSRSLSAPLSSPIPLSADDDNDNDDEMACIMMKKSNTTYPWISMKCSTSPVFFICQRGYDYYKSYDSDTWSGPYPQEDMDPSWFAPSTTQGTTIRSSTHLTPTQSTITTQNITTTISTMNHQTSVINNIDRTNSNNNISNTNDANNNNHNNSSNNNNNNNNYNNTNNNNNNTNNNNNNGDYLLPPQSVVENETFSKMKIAIIAFIIILFLLFILLVLMCILLCCYCRKRQKTLTVKELDARPVAHLPESDAGHVMTTSSTEKLQDHDQLER